ncbi:hypothetical protein [Streptomyces sp. NBC_00096]|uniref:hypothetical protein n=1 Tax=Streptomyces sp. NBC_00096 TaxID=2975650 RepID=UPI0032561AE1
MSHNTGWGQYPHPEQPVPQWGGGWMPPPAPQPGVIPLKPLGPGEIVGGAFAAFRRHWKPLIGIMLLVQGIAIVVVAVVAAITVAAAYGRFSAVFDLGPGESPDGAAVAGLLLALVPAGVVLFVVAALGAALIAALCPAVVQEAVLGRPATFGALLRRSWSRLPSVLGALLLTGLVAGGPVLLLYAIGIPLLVVSSDSSGPAPGGVALLFLGVLVCVPFSVWLTTRFSLAPAAAVIEGLGPVAALRRSSRLVSDGWWRVFGITLLGYLVASAVGYAIQLPFSFVGMFALFPSLPEAGDTNVDLGSMAFGFLVYAGALLVGAMISSLFQFTYPQLALALLYVDQRIRKEDLAASLVAAAHPAETARPAAPPEPEQG